MTTVAPTFRPVLQTRYGVPEGNCFSACIASVLGLPLSEVPDYQCDYSDPDWWAKWEAWFAARGLRVDMSWDSPAGYAVAQLAAVPHSVVVLDGRIVWNPEGGEALPAGTPMESYMALVPIT